VGFAYSNLKYNYLSSLRDFLLAKGLEKAWQSPCRGDCRTCLPAKAGLSGAKTYPKASQKRLFACLRDILTDISTQNSR
jgi:hypothetical protein